MNLLYVGINKYLFTCFIIVVEDELSVDEQLTCRAHLKPVTTTNQGGNQCCLLPSGVGTSVNSEFP